MDPEGSTGGMGTHKDLEQGRRARSKGEKKGADQVPSKKLEDAIQGFLSTKTSLKEFTLTNYRRQLENQVTEIIPATTPLRELEWDNGGREKVRALRTHIEDRGSYDQAFRVQKVLAQALDYAILQGWMRRNQNPATKQKGEESKHAPSTTRISSGKRCQNCWKQST